MPPQTERLTQRLRTAARQRQQKTATLTGRKRTEKIRTVLTEMPAMPQRQRKRNFSERRIKRIRKTKRSMS